MSLGILFLIQSFIKRILHAPGSDGNGHPAERPTIERMTTHGKLNDDTISFAKDVFPLPEDPATPMILVLAQGGE